MDTFPVWAKIATICGLLFLSACFSITETAMLSLNRHRLRYLVKKNALGAKQTQQLLARTDRLLSFILIGNNLVNTMIPVLSTSLVLSLFGNDNFILAIATGIVAFLIIVFAEITPKIVGATFPEKVALPASLIVRPLLKLSAPLVWVSNALSKTLLKILNISLNKADNRLSLDELRAMVIDSSHHVPQQSRSILLNLFDLDNIVVEDVMIPRSRLEAIDIDEALPSILSKLKICHHNQVVFYEGNINCVIGVLHVRKIIAALHENNLDIKQLRQLLDNPYFVPADTAVFQQLKFFQENKKSFGIVVDEYGDILGIVTPEDIIEELIGEFTTTVSNEADPLHDWDANNTCVISGTTQLRELNRKLHLNFPLNGPKTLSGLILERLTEIPVGSVCLEIDECRLECLEINGQLISSVKLIKNE